MIKVLLLLALGVWFEMDVCLVGLCLRLSWEHCLMLVG